MGLIVFDLVSTLIDSGPRYVEAYIRVSQEYAQEHLPTRSELTRMLGEKNLKQIVAACSPQIQELEMPGFMQACNNMCDRLLTEDDWSEQLYPGTETALERLKNQGHELGIFTGTREDAMLAQIFHHGLIKYFTSSYIEGKNNQKQGMLNTIFLKTSQLRNIKNNYINAGGKIDDILIIGDSPSDFIAACKFEMPFIGIARNEDSEALLKSFGIKRVLSSIEMIPDLFLNKSQNSLGSTPHLNIN